MATNVLTPPITPEQFAALPSRENYELVAGRLVERKMGNKASWIAFELAYHLQQYVRAHKLGWVFCGLDTGFRLVAKQHESIRKPDVAFIRFGRLPREEPGDTFDNVAPDLAAEVVSRHDTVLDLEEKIDEYLQAGVRLVWVINSERKTLTVHRTDRAPLILREGDEMDGEDVVLGFRLPLAALFQMPKPD